VPDPAPAAQPGSTAPAAAMPPARAVTPAAAMPPAHAVTPAAAPSAHAAPASATASLPATAVPPTPAIATPPAPAVPAAAAVRAQGLVKCYGSFTAVDGIDFAVLPGECFGFLGPNGAGKTTTMKMIYGACLVTAGSLTVMGVDVRTDIREAKRRIGVVPQDENLEFELSCVENLQVYGRFHGLDRRRADRRARELLSYFELADRADARVETLSGGMRRRLLIARGLIGDPAILILDEPTVGLDPAVRALLWAKLNELKAKGVTLILTTHYMDEAERLCDRLVVIDKGKVVVEGSPRDLIARHVGAEVLELRFAANGAPSPLERYRDRILRHETVHDSVLVFTPDADDLLHRMTEDGAGMVSALVRRASLEDVFLRLTGRRLE